MSKSRSTSAITENESVLAQQLKSLCRFNGREKYPKESAKIFHQLGLEYKSRSPDKVSLIQSAVLINAAIVRSPENVEEIKEDLQKLCSEVLLRARAKKKDANLIKASMQVKKEVMKMREMVNLELDKLKHIPFYVDENELYEMEEQKIADIQRIQESTSKQYTNIMHNISEFCSSVMGEQQSKCKFTLVGMGSLARQEITPYSDFENIIVLEEDAKSKSGYEDIAKYFRWFSVIFQIILANMGETVIPCVGIPSLNDFFKEDGNWFYDAFTTCGVRFDGMNPHACKFPLGRQQPTEKKSWKTELIKPIREMIHYLDTEEDLKNGYHLADILTKTCFVYGDIEVYNEFRKGVDEKLTLLQKEYNFFTKMEKQVRKDKVKFNIKEMLTKAFKKSTFNIKQVIYRTSTIFISALGKFYGIKESSCFEIISELAQKGLITEFDKHKLKYATAVACEVRLKIYMKKQQQDDVIQHSEDESSEVIGAVESRSIVDYFMITSELQENLPMFKKDRELQSQDQKLHFSWSDNYADAAQNCIRLHLHSECIHYCDLELQNLKEKGSTKSKKGSLTYFLKATCLLEQNKPAEALEQFEQAQNIRKLISNNENTDVEVANCLYQIGICQQSMEKYEKALQQFDQELQILKRISKDKTTDCDIADSKYQTGICQQSLNKYEEALQPFEQALCILKKISSDGNTDKDIATTLYQIGMCKQSVGKYEEAFQCFEQELNIRKRISDDETTDGDIADTLHEMGCCKKEMKKYEEALKHFEQELNIRKRISDDETTDGDIADTLHEMGCCKKKMEKYEEALKHFEHELHIRKRLFRKETTDDEIEECNLQMAICMSMECF